jgi:hypothetical protein
VIKSLPDVLLELDWDSLFFFCWLFWSLFHNFLIICNDSMVLSNLILGEGQSKPTETSFIASPVPIPRAIRLGYNTSREAKA